MTNGAVPKNPQIVHIVHVDRLPSVIEEGHLWCDAVAAERSFPGTTIGIGEIKQRRMSHPLMSHPTLKVGECVPFYFWPRSVMLFLFARGNHPALAYRGGQAPIVHLVADLRKTVRWAEESSLRWAFTLSNAGAAFFEDRSTLDDLGDIDWAAVKARDWRDPEVKEHKQAEFLVESRFAWQLVSRIGVMTEAIRRQVADALAESEHRPRVEVQRTWYY